jgi:hypothetical protein
METFNGQQLTPVFNFYTIVITKNNKDVNKDNFSLELETLTKKVKSTKKGIWLKIDETIYKKLDIKLLQLLQKEYTFYYNDTNENNLIFVATKLKTYPPAPNTNIGTHFMIMTPDNQILTTIEDDGKGNDIISIPGGQIDVNDNDNGIEQAIMREFGEEITKSIKINKSKLKLVTLRQVPLFPRLGNMYKNQDIWFLYTLELSKSDCNKIITHYKQSNGGAKSLQLMNLETLSKKVGWLSKDIFTALKCNCDVKIHHSKNAYNNNEGYFYY